jgi:hypothetical protein
VKVRFEDVFDPEEHVPKARPSHQRRQRRAVSGDRRRHRLNAVLQVIEARIEDRPAQRFEATDVERDVIVDQENRFRSVSARVANVGQDSIEVVGVKVSTAHLDDRAEAAIERTAPRRLDDIDLPSNHRVPRQDARAPIGQADVAAGERRDGPIRVGHERLTTAVREARDAVVTAIGLDRAQQVPKRDLALASHDEVCAGLWRRVIGLRGQAGVVAAHDDVRLGSEPAHEIDDFQGRSSLERHHRQSHHVGSVPSDQLLERLSHALLDQDEIGHGHAMVGVDVARE